MCIVSPALSAAACAATRAAIASSSVALASRVVAIAYCPMCAASVASCSALSWFASAFATAFAATCYLFIISLAPRLSKCVWSFASFEGIVLCLVRCSIRSLACFPLFGSSLSRRCSISGVSGIGSLTLMFPALECVPDALDNEPKLRRSLSLSLVPLPCSAIGSYLFMSWILALVAGAAGAMLPLLPLVPMVSHVVLGGPGFANESQVRS